MFQVDFEVVKICKPDVSQYFPLISANHTTFRNIYATNYRSNLIIKNDMTVCIVLCLLFVLSCLVTCTVCQKNALGLPHNSRGEIRLCFEIIFKI